MPAFQRQATIDRSPGQVFAVLDDLQAAPKWMPAIRKLEVLTPDKPMGMGFQWRETRRIMGFIPIRIPLTVTTHQAPKAWGITYDDGKMRMQATFTLKPVAAGAGTSITLDEAMEPLTMSPKRVERMFKGMEKQDDDLLQRLKAYVESTAAPAAPARKPKPKPAAKKGAKKAK